jgi:glycosyltransferase involved in cell wall biosynthesis
MRQCLAMSAQPTSAHPGGHRLRILLDMRHRNTLSGSVSYIYNILPHLIGASNRHEFVVLRYTGQNLPKEVDCETVDLEAQSGATQMVFDQMLLPKLIRSVRPDIYHPLKYLGSMRPSCPQVTTLHAITEPYKGEFPTRFVESIYWRHLGRRILTRSAHIIAVSAYVGEFLAERLGIPEERITVIPHGIDPRFRKLPRDVDGKDERECEYILTVGNLFPVKNFVVAVEVLAALAAEFPALRLRMAGATNHSYYHKIRAEAYAAGVADRIDFLGYLPPEELVPLMNHCKLLLMPSLTEGCPVTLLEAMACGAPVVGSKRGGIPEIGANAIVLVDDPHDRCAWAAAARALLKCDEERGQLSASAVRRAAQFSWERAARETLGVYEQVGA